MKLSLLKKPFAVLLAITSFVIVTSFTLPFKSHKGLVAQKLYFDVMVLDRAKLDAIFQQSNHILFQTVNKASDNYPASTKRHRYKLVAYQQNATGGYDPIPTGNLFVNHSVSPRRMEKQNGAATDETFGNLILDKSFIPNPAPQSSFKYVVLDPRRSKYGDNYVEYVAYYAESLMDIPPSGPPEESIKAIQLTGTSLNPSPPAK